MRPVFFPSQEPPFNDFSHWQDMSRFGCEVKIHAVRTIHHNRVVVYFPFCVFPKTPRVTFSYYPVFSHFEIKRNFIQIDAMLGFEREAFSWWRPGTFKICIIKSVDFRCYRCHTQQQERCLERSQFQICCVYSHVRNIGRGMIIFFSPNKQTDLCSCKVLSM